MTPLRDEPPSRALDAAELAEMLSGELAETSSRARGPFAEMRAWRDRLHAILQFVGEAIAILDFTGAVVYVNVAACEFLGIADASEVLGRDVDALYRERVVRDESGAPIEPGRRPGSSIFRGDVADDALLRLVDPVTGEERFAMVRSAPIVDERNGVLAVIQVFRDVTAEERSRRQIELLASASGALAAAPDAPRALEELVRLPISQGIADWCLLDVVPEHDRSVYERIAVSCADVAGGAFAEQLRGRYAMAREDTVLGRALRAGELQRVDKLDAGALRALFAGDARVAALGPGLRSLLCVPLTFGGPAVGALTLLSMRRAFSDTDVALVGGLARIATSAIEHARLYQAARRAAAEAAEANRVKDEFLAIVSHELRTPLNAINGWARLLTRRLHDRAAVSNGLAIIRRNAEAQTRIVEDILDVSRIMSGKLHIEPLPIDLGIVVRDAIDVVRPSAEAKAIEIRFDADAPPAMLMGDPERLRQVVWNLLSNAVKFTDDGGFVDVRIERDGTRVRLFVTDTGRGIAPEFLPCVFERFRQADSSTTRKHGGLGLGLAIARHVVELHGGEIAAESPGIGQGTTFIVSLPARVEQRATGDDGPRSSAHPQDETRGGARADDANAAPLRDTKVLVVEQEPDSLELALEVLLGAGATVEAVSSTRAAREAVRRFRPDIVVCDVATAEEEGAPLLEWLRSLSPEEGGALPAIALTAHARLEDRMRALRAGFSNHVTKPVDPRELVVVVQSVRAILLRRP